MAVSNITYDNKVSISTSTLPAANVVRASDMNEIKTVVNNNANSVPRYYAAFSIPIDAVWSASNDVPKYGYRTKVNMTGVTENDFVQLFPNQATNSLGLLSCQNNSLSGGVYVYVNKVPTVVLNFTGAIVTRTE